MTFQIDFCTIQSLARLACLKVMHITWIDKQTIQCAQQSVLMQAPLEILLVFFLPKIVKKRFPQDFLTLPKIFIQLYKQ